MSQSKINREEFLRELADIEDLPTLPAIAQQVIALAIDPNANFKKFSRLIQSDPPLAARVLKTANSAFFGRLQPAKTIDDAIFTIGLDDLSAICTSIGVIKSFSHWKQQNLDYQLLWKHSISTAALLDKMIRHEKLYGAVNLFLSGLLHDIGWMVVDHIAPESVSRALAVCQQGEIWSPELEIDIIGISHAEAGALILERWKIADEHITLTRWHNDPEKAEGLASHAFLLQFASALAPYQIPLSASLKEEISPFITIELKATNSSEALEELKERYAKHIKHAEKYTDMSVGWM